MNWVPDQIRQDLIRQFAQKHKLHDQGWIRWVRALAQKRKLQDQTWTRFSRLQEDAGRRATADDKSPREKRGLC